MKRTRLWLAGIILSISMLGVVACTVGVRSPITAVPANVNQSEVQNWRTAVDDFNIVVVSYNEASAIAIQLSKSMPKAMPVSVLVGLRRINTFAKSGVRLLRASPDNFSQPVALQITSLATQILGEIAKLAVPPSIATQTAKMQSAAINIQGLK